MAKDMLESEEAASMSSVGRGVATGLTFVGSVVMDALAHGGIGGGIFCLGAAAGAYVVAPHIRPFARPMVERVTAEFKSASNVYRERQNKRQEAQDEIEVEMLPQAIPPPRPSVNVAGNTPAPPPRLDAIFPPYPENETLRLGHIAATGQRFDPHVNGLIGQGLIAAAMQGWGKSQLVGRIVEQCGKCGMMVVLFDHKGEHETITDLPYINGLRAGADRSAGFQLTADNAAEFVQLVMGRRHQAIINLPSYGIKWIERAAIVSAVGRALMNYAEEKRKKRQRVMPCLVLLDEAQLYIPQDPSFLPPEAQSNKEIQGELKNSFFALATNGRSAGYTVGFATQSLTFITKALIKSCAIQVLGRHVEKNALDMCEDIIDDDSVATRAEVKTFPKGKGVTFGFTEEPLVVQFDKKESHDLSETPTIEWLREPRKSVPLPTPEPESHPAATAPREVNTEEFSNLQEAMVGRIVASLRAQGSSEQEIGEYLAQSLITNKPVRLSEQQLYVPKWDTVPMNRQSAQPRSQMPVQVLQEAAVQQPARHAKYQKALEAWNAGSQSVRSLASALRITDSAAYNLMRDMDRLGLIQMKKKN